LFHPLSLTYLKIPDADGIPKAVEVADGIPKPVKVADGIPKAGAGVEVADDIPKALEVADGILKNSSAEPNRPFVLGAVVVFTPCSA